VLILKERRGSKWGNNSDGSDCSHMGVDQKHYCQQGSRL